jgi:thermopsin
MNNFGLLFLPIVFLCFMLFIGEYAASIRACNVQLPANIQQNQALSNLVNRQYMGSLPAKGEPVDIHRVYSSAPVPTGIADYGEENESGYEVPYTILTNNVVGHAEILSMSAYNGTQTLVNPYCASLQLNIVLQINTTSSQKDYWLQDMADFNTNENSLFFTDNIWNVSSPKANMTSTIVFGHGSVSYYNITGEYYYGCNTSLNSYSFPLSFNLPISILASTNFVNVTFAYQILTNGQDLGIHDPTNYDTAAIMTPGVTDASIIISGNSLTPTNNYYDAELVFGGEFDGEVTAFTQMNSTLSMHYLMPNGTIIAPYAVYGFGSDTAERAYNLETIMANGSYNVVLGQPNFNENYTTVQVYLPLSLSSFTCKFSSISPFLTNSCAHLNLTISGGFAPFSYVWMDNGMTVCQTKTNSRTAIYNYSPSSMGRHDLTVTVTDAAGHSVTSQPIAQFYGFNDKTVLLSVGAILATAVIIAIVTVFLLRRKKARATNLVGSSLFLYRARAFCATADTLLPATGSRMF